MKTLKELKLFIILWLTQSLSSLGSAMTNFALVIWLYQDSGSALKTSLLTVCSYAPYVIMSIFAGAVSDKWNKNDHAYLRQRCGIMQYCNSDLTENRRSGSVASLHAQRCERIDEFDSSAGFRCCVNSSHARTPLSKNKRNAFFFGFACINSDACFCHGNYFICRHRSGYRN